MKGDKNILNFFKTRKYIKNSKNQKYYPYCGIDTYLGYMGSGKTLTSIKRIRELKEKYPKVTLISNVKIKGIEDTIYFKNCDELITELKKIDINNNYGYLIFIDEIHVVLAELFGKTDPIFLQFLSQQRKLSIHIIGTSQMFNYLPKFIRKYLLQSGQIYMCKNIFKCIQINKKIEMETVVENGDGTFNYKKCKIEWYIHNKELYNSYDTFAVITQIQGLMKGSLNYGDRLSSYNEPTAEI